MTIETALPPSVKVRRLSRGQKAGTTSGQSYSVGTDERIRTDGWQRAHPSHQPPAEPIRLILWRGVQALGIPMVHGSIAGFLGQIMTIFPPDPQLSGLHKEPGQLPEQELGARLGTPAATPVAVAA